MTKSFTLIEMLVSVALFSIIMVVAASAYINLISIDRQTRALNDVVNNLSFSLDSMARTIRTGSRYCVNGCFTSSFSFVDANGCTDTYLLSGAQISESAFGGSSCESGTLTDSRINVSSLVFNVKNQGSGSGAQPEVIITVHGTLVADPQHTESFTVETSATQRSINI